ncbi:protein FANTASTIC FOUR 3-like [Abrus precatorius]|uniref:Protein FANTASTIC FOUR 3-like n=1 Tax=Abrus precatorius TaxID=3816 RepID=A0A8B8KF30_ABRPR|nr:protein FANTASTIC FOUR 3-like [Abrus precatorius]
MATTCGGLQHIFDTLLPENPTLLESLSWNQIKTVKSIDQTPSFTEIFGELHFKESPVSVSSPSSSLVSTTSSASTTPKTNHTNRHKSSDSFSSLSSESLHLCTEGLGFESSDDVEDLKSRMDESWERYKEKEGVKKRVTSEGECKRGRVNGGEYPPPISCIGRSGKPWVCFKSYRSNGRFILKEIRIPSQELLHAYRENGRLKLHFVQPDDEFIEEEDDDDDDVESVDEEEENDGCVKDYANEEKEIDAQVTSNSLDERQKI